MNPGRAEKPPGLPAMGTAIQGSSGRVVLRPVVVVRAVMVDIG